jgi:hypothetical protein
VIFFSQNKSDQQPADNTFLLQQISTSHQPNEQTLMTFVLSVVENIDSETPVVTFSILMI